MTADAIGPRANINAFRDQLRAEKIYLVWSPRPLPYDYADTKVFDKVVVITDRVVLDRQLQETIYQFEHARGVVVKIDKDSAQLAEALVGEQAWRRPQYSYGS
jgi:hypothetical protein